MKRSKLFLLFIFLFLLCGCADHKHEWGKWKDINCTKVVNRKENLVYTYACQERYCKVCNLSQLDWD